MNAGTEQQLTVAINAELVHLAAVALYGLFTGCIGVIVWLFRRSVRNLDDHLKKIDERLENIDSQVRENCEGVEWCKGVLLASGLTPRPLGPGIGGTS